LFEGDVWTQLKREGSRVARLTIERLMRAEGLSGARRGKAFKVTTTPGDEALRPADMVERAFTAPTPNRLWVADLTHVKMHSGWVYVAFVALDMYRRLGFVVEGTMVEYGFERGRYIDAYAVARLNGEVPPCGSA
jgi:putative transposase